MWNIPLRAFRTLLQVSVLVLCALPMHGQTANTGAIAGTVSDPSGALVACAAVVVKSQATQEERDLTTDAEGNFSIPFLSPGNYDLTVRAPGFEPLVLKDVQVQITEVSRLKIQLPIGGAKEQIAVSAKPPLIQTENATLGRVIDHESVVDLPLVDRNFTEILGLTAGTNTNIVDATQLGAGSQEIRANGARSGDNNFMLNGVDANSYSSNIAVRLTLIEHTDWFLAERGTCPVQNTRKAQPFGNSEMAGASRVSLLCSLDSLSASWTAQPEHCLVLQPYIQQQAWLLEPHLPMPAGVAASAAV
ncbi:MAG: Cna protein B-type domain, TonB-dependent Receptor Plug Domain protein [Edaphobacter sp.]|nr:Cna protein B-type domain, TonB-dependent Receptor Plug Domain protein [Edaphobacter sp.]